MLINIDTIIHDDDRRIRMHSEDVALPLSEEDQTLARDMLQYVLDSQDEDLCKEKRLQPAVGISAIQVAVPKKLIAVVVPAEEGEEDIQLALANPKIVSYSDKMAYIESGEGCLSVPENREGHVYRPWRIKVKATDALTGEPVVIKAKGFLAMVLQHEIDHLSGTLYYDHIDPEDPFRTDPEAVVL